MRSLSTSSREIFTAPVTCRFRVRQSFSRSIVSSSVMSRLDCSKALHSTACRVTVQANPTRLASQGTALTHDGSPNCKEVKNKKHLLMIRSAKRRAVEAYSLMSFLCDRYTRGLVVSEIPMFNNGGLKVFSTIIARTSVYLEYGSGGSTLLASQNANLTVSVDSDKWFLDAVTKRLDRLSTTSIYQPFYVNIGFTKLWGNPVFTEPTERRLKRWRRYASAPWEFFQRQGIEPDTILIDGRFRVACSLQSFLSLEEASTC